jgi:hypothetical protein
LFPTLMVLYLLLSDPPWPFASQLTFISICMGNQCLSWIYPRAIPQSSPCNDAVVPWQRHWQCGSKRARLLKNHQRIFETV